MGEFLTQAVLSLGIAMALLWSIENRQRLMRLEDRRIAGEHGYPKGLAATKSPARRDG